MVDSIQVPGPGSAVGLTIFAAFIAIGLIGQTISWDVLKTAIIGVILWVVILCILAVLNIERMHLNVNYSINVTNKIESTNKLDQKEKEELIKKLTELKKPEETFVDLLRRSTYLLVVIIAILVLISLFVGKNYSFVFIT